MEFVRTKLFDRWWLNAALPTVCFLMAYFLTSVIAATAYAIVPNGWRLMETIGVFAPANVVADIGSSIYYLLLFLPLVIVPLAAIISALAIDFLIRKKRVFNSMQSLPIDRLTLVALMICSFGYCAFRLSQFDALNLDVLTCADQSAKLAQRMLLLEKLGYLYFMFAYGINMMLPIISYIAYERHGRHKIDLFLFIISLLAMVFFVLETYSKAPILVFLLMMTCCVLVLRAHFRYLLVASLVCVGFFLLIGAVVYASQSCGVLPDHNRDYSTLKKSSLGDEGAKSVEEPQAGMISDSRIGAVARAPEASKNHQVEVGQYLSRLLAFGVLQRMAVGVPFYVHMYATPNAHCGIQ